MRPRRLPLAVVLLLASCKAAPQIAAVVGGGVAGAASGSPAVGFAVGVATDAAATAVVQYYGRTRQQAEQDAIAEAAGMVPPGGQANWKIEHDIPIGNEHGSLQVVRQIDNPLALCKQIVFSVDEGKGEKLKRAWYSADICHRADKWKWASAEPAVERWGYLQ
ncbi:MAG: hypothetical protein P4L71_18040 [Acetobacteraceae bacterium]|nr:hypothetical protein [Acetobacteraceae bacterium]